MIADADAPHPSSHATASPAAAFAAQGTGPGYYRSRNADPSRTPHADHSFHILLVEDDPAAVVLLEEMLATKPDFRCDFVHAARLATAAEVAEKSTFDVVLLDLGLPHSTGLDTLERALTALPDLPIIVLTSMADDELGLRAISAGAVDYLVKDRVEIDALVAAIRYAVERSENVGRLRKVGERLRGDAARVEDRAIMTAHELSDPLANAEEALRRLMTQVPKSRFPLWGLDDLRSIEQATFRMRMLVSDLMVFGRIGNGDVPYQPVALLDLVECVLDDYRPRLRKRAIEVDIAGDLPAVHGRLSDIEAVYENLVSNAIAHVEGCLKPRIEIGYEAVDGELLFWVGDNGRGFDPTHADKVFEPYYKLDGDGRGTGLGLAIVKKAVEAHGGRAWIETAPGSGTWVFFTLPAELLVEGVAGSA